MKKERRNEGRKERRREKVGRKGSKEGRKKTLLTTAKYFIAAHIWLSVQFSFPGGSDSKASCLQCRRGEDPLEKGNATPQVFSPGKSHGQRNLVGYSPWNNKELDMTEQLHFLSFLSVQFSRSVVSNSLQPHGLQEARLPTPSPTPRACSNSCPLSQWCHPTISSSVIPFSRPQIKRSLNQGLFQWVISSHQVDKELEFQFQLQHQSFQRIFKTYFFKIDWLDLLAVQGTLKSLL